jgi:hypothetical protein
MYLIIKNISENCAMYDKTTYGKTFIDTCDNTDEFKEIVKQLHDSDFFEQPNGSVTDQQGNEIFHPKTPDYIDFGDFSYGCWSALALKHNLDTNFAKEVIRAVEKESPHNMAEIMRIVYKGRIDHHIDLNMCVEAIYADDIIDVLDAMELSIMDYDTQFDDDDECCIITVQFDTVDDLIAVKKELEKIGHKLN